MAVAKITKRVVDQLQKGGMVWDTEVRGFGVRRQTTDAVFYLLRYRLSSKQSFYSIGQHGSPWTPEEAEAWVLETNLHRRHLTAKQKQEMVRARIKKCPGMSNRQIAKQLGVSHTMVADERERLTNPPELRKFQELKDTWEALSDEHRKAFVKEFSLDLSDLQKSIVEQSSIANPRMSVMA